MKRLFVKALRDLLRDRHRAIVSLLAIVIGMTSFGVMLFSYNVIEREIRNVFTATNPASASVIVDGVDNKLIELTKSFNGITSFEEKADYEYRVQTGKDEWKALNLFAAKDYNSLKMNTVRQIDGIIQPRMNEALIEISALGVAKTSLNNDINIVIPNSEQKKLRLVGSINDLSLHPAYMHNVVYAYVSLDTLASIGLKANKIDFMIAGNQYDRQNILTISNEYVKMLEENGYTVKKLAISATPGVSMHLSEYEGTLFLLQLFSFVSFIFGCMIMANLLSSIISNQIKQIGILKAIGAETKKILAAYMLALSILIVSIVSISLPLSIIISKKFSVVLMALGNMTPTDTNVPISLYMLFCALGLTVPVLVTYFPIQRGLKITVKDAINNYGINSSSGVDNSLIHVKFLSRPILLSLRNSFRRKGRFWVNISILALGGALFVAVVTSMLSIQTALTNNSECLKYDYQIITSNSINDENLTQEMKNIPLIKEFENWGSSVGKLIYEDGRAGNLYSIFGMDSNSKMMKPHLLDGKWLDGANKNQVVVSHKFLIAEPNYKIGDSIEMQIGKTKLSFEIVGVIKDFATSGVYLNKSSFEELITDQSKQKNIKIITQSDSKNKRSLYSELEAQLKEHGIIVLQSESKVDTNKIVQEHFSISLQTFSSIIFMIIVVLSFGLAATMNVQTAERTKEIGIMKSMGASKKQIMKIVTAESIFIGLFSWIIAGFLGLAFSIAGVSVFAKSILKTPLDFSVIPFITSYGLWLILIFIVGYFASRYAAKRAAKMSIKDALVFE